MNLKKILDKYLINNDEEFGADKINNVVKIDEMQLLTEFEDENINNIKTIENLKELTLENKYDTIIFTSTLLQWDESITNIINESLKKGKTFIVVANRKFDFDALIKTFGSNFDVYSSNNTKDGVKSSYFVIVMKTI